MRTQRLAIKAETLRLRASAQAVTSA